MKWRRKLFRFKSLFGTEESNELFFKAVKENCEYHYRKNPQYRAMLESQGFSPDQLTCYEDIAKLPFLPTLLFKGRELYSVPKHRIPIKATSSGTKGKFSRIGFGCRRPAFRTAYGAKGNKISAASLASPHKLHYLRLPSAPGQPKPP